MISRYKLDVLAVPPAGKGYPISVNNIIAITDDGRGIGKTLAEQLQTYQYNAKVYEQVPANADVVILLEGLKQFSNEQEAIEVNRQAFNNTRMIAERFSLKGGLFLTVQNTGGRFGLTPFKNENAWSAGLAGLAKTAAQEWPKATCRALDVDLASQTSDSIAKRLLQEILAGGDEVECGLAADEKRFIIRTSSASVSSGKKTIDKNSVLVVSGGARGVTAACLIKLAEQTQAKFVLLGRTKLTDEPASCKNCSTEMQLRQALFSDIQQKGITANPKEINQQVAQILAVREIHHNLELLRKAGSEVLYSNVDVLDYKALAHLLESVREKWGAITGIIHGAGVLADKLISQKTIEQFDRVFSTKVEGLRNLLQATSKDKLNFIGLFSSVAARFGNTGQVAYAMANEVLNKVAQFERQRRGKKCLVKSFNWGPWEMGMVTPELKKLFEQRGVALLSVEQGVQMFLDELNSDNDEVEIVCGGILQPSLKEKKKQDTYSVGLQSHSFLQSHVIKGEAVLPACLVLEWFIRSAQMAYPTLNIVNCNNFKVLHGIRLENFAENQQDFSVLIEENPVKDSQTSLALTLIDKTGRPCYSAQIIMHSQKAEFAAESHLFNLDESKAWPWQLRDIYDNNDQRGILFHGKAFQAIYSLDSLSTQTGAATLQGLSHLNWPQDNWQIDVPALDGVLQLLLLWGFHKLKQRTLPTSIAQFVKYADRPYQGQLKCFFRCETRGNYRLLADAVLYQADNKPYAELHGIEMCVAQI